MKRCSILLIIMFFLFSGCGETVSLPLPSTSPVVWGAELVDSEGVVKITVSSLPEGYQRTYTAREKVAAVTGYVDGLALTADPGLEPANGMVWVIGYTYEDGSQVTMYHSGNQTFRVESGEALVMTYEQAQAFSELIWEHPSDEE